MRTLRPSLLWKLILAIWIVSISGIIIIVLIAGQVTRQEFNRFVISSQHTSVVDDLASYYAASGTWNGAESILAEEARNLPPNGGSLQVVSPSGIVQLSTVQGEIGTQISSFQASHAIPIIVNGRETGMLVTNWPDPNMAQAAAPNINRMNLALLIAAISLTVFALLAGWVMARTVIRPVRVLSEATHSISRGDLDTQVSIASNDEIGELAASFESMRQSLKKSRDLRRQMTADIAHELRNPLSIILGNAEAMNEGILLNDPDIPRIIYEEAKHLSSLVEDLHTLSLSEAGELHLNLFSVDIRSTLEQLALAFQSRAKDQKMSIQVTTAPGIPEVEFDPERMGQVFSNLLDNSLKYGRKGGKVHLDAVSTPQGIQITIEDDGTGIPAEELPHIFDRFYRGKDSRQLAWQGSGLGLAISKALVELHHGKINVESEVGKGTRFIILLPFSPIPHSGISPKNPENKE